MQSNLPPMAALRAFVTVARLGSVVAAAEELHVTHGAVSHQIRALEAFTGISLIERHGRRTKVTEAGRVYAYQLRQSLEGVESATRRVREMSNPSEIRVSSLPSFVMGWLMPRLHSWLKTKPGLRLQLHSSMSFIDFREEAFDCAIRFGSGEWPDVNAARFLGDSLILVAAPGLYASPPKTVKEALSRPVLHSSESWALWLTAGGDSDSRAPTPIMEFTDSTHLIDGVRRGLGIGLTRRTLVQELLDNGELLQITDVEPAHESSYYLVWPHRTKSSDKIDQLLEWLRQQSELVD
ncbi:LysR substrate-binding domain-containing protein [Pseudomonas sp. RA_105y_Pfl2_P56]|uniref:LysR substrate-binding domain-containing protein n=1 Tax=Pseudomonas sp. RA_105y_Pfl2_P56 TaxID=3088701 RepID=UPI0030DBDF02